MNNLTRIFNAQNITHSESNLRQMALENFRMFGKYIVDFFKISNFASGEARKLVDIENFEYLENAEALGKGVIILTAHLGNWELGGAVLASTGKKLNAVVLPLRSNKVNKLFQKHRESRGIHLIPLGQAARGVILALRKKELVAMLADRDYTTNKETITLFGNSARLPTGPARIAKRTGAPLVPVFLLRQPNDRFLLKLYPPIFPHTAKSADELRLVIRDVLQTEIAKNPLQWFMFENFWETENNK